MPLIEIAASDKVQENQLLPVKSTGTSLLLTRVNGQVQAFANKCPHLGLPLAKGKLVDGAVTCPWHGASFDICTGENLEWCNGVAGARLPDWSHKLLALGRSPAALAKFDAQEENGKVFVRLPG